MNEPVRVFGTPFELAESFAGEIVQKIKDAGSHKRHITLALSGGSTPELLFSILGDHFTNAAPWSHVHFFWGDERCVPPVSPDSNFGMAFRNLIKKIKIPENNIHRIYGEKEPSGEARRYAALIEQHTKKKENLPAFDMIILGMGEDGHTASIFPGLENLFVSEKICEVSVHPVTRQKRITLTGPVINNADNVKFLVTGRKKSEIVRQIINKEGNYMNFPASHIVPVHGTIEWLLDAEAASLL
jgi:6-phosphogluconolactonase